MRKPLFLSLCLLILCFSVSAQNILKGTVRDTIGEPLPFANIIAEPHDSLHTIKFAISDDHGNYELKLENIRYTVSASFMGYATTSFESSPHSMANRDIILHKHAEGLDEVVIDLPVVVKNDTIVYNVGKLVTGEERKLKDVLRKLPGVEVSKDGSVSVQGRKITTLLVENKKFFGGGTKLAIDNIPADAVNQVEILENYNEIAFLKNLQDSEEIAMNVKLKEDKKNFVFGDIEAGKGNRKFYRAHSNTFYYSPAANVNSIANFNNIREQVFTYDQFFEFQGGMNQIFNQGTTGFDLPNQDFLQFIEKEDVVSSDRKFGALNFTQEVNNKLTISGYGIFSATRENTKVSSRNEYNGFTEDSEVNSGTHNSFAIGNLKAVFIPNLTDQWHFKTHFKRTKDRHNKNIISTIESTDNSFLMDKNVEETYFNQVLEFHSKRSKNHTFSFVSKYTFSDLQPNNFWETTDLILNGLIPFQEESVYRINQLKRLKNDHLDAIVKYYWLMSRNHHFSATIGNTYLNQKFFTQEKQLRANGDVNDFNKEVFGNDLSFILNDLFFGIHYKAKLGIFTLDQGLFMHSYNWKVNQVSSVDRSKLLLLPSFSVKADFSQTKELELDYRLNSKFSDVAGFAKRYYLYSYNTIYSGNNTLENNLSHNFKLRYSKFSTYRGYRFYAILNYTEEIKGVTSAISVKDRVQRISAIYLQDTEKQWSFYTKTSKKVSDINLSLGLRYNHTKYKQLVNDDLVTNKNTNVSYTLSAKTLFDDFPVVEVGFKQNIGTYELNGRSSEFRSIEPYINGGYNFLNSLSAFLDYTYFNYKNTSFNQRNHYEIANASLRYKKESSAWSFKLEAQNIFDVDFKNSNSFSTYLISDTRTYILPRILMFSIGYNL